MAINRVEPMTPEAPVRPEIKKSNKKVVRYMDGEIEAGDLEQLKAIASELQCYLYFYRDWDEDNAGLGYGIMDTPEGCSGCIIADYDILDFVAAEDGIKCIDADEIFHRFDMEYDMELESKVVLL